MTYAKSLLSSSGGIAGYNYGTISNAVNYSDVLDSALITNNNNNSFYPASLTAYSGGIAGINKGTIEMSTNSGSITSYSYYLDHNANINYFSYTNAYAGGIVGWNNGTIVECQNTGIVNAQIKLGSALSAPFSSAGGIAGSSGTTDSSLPTITKTINKGAISSSYTGSVSSQLDSYSVSGGIAGSNGQNSTISNSINYGNVSSKHLGGGLIGGGWWASRLLNSYSVSRSVSGVTLSNGYIGFGGVAGDLSGGLIANCFYNTDSLANVTAIGWHGNQDSVYNATGKTTAEMKKDMFAWSLNTTSGTDTNSRVWTRVDSFPEYSDDANKPIYRIRFLFDLSLTNSYAKYSGIAIFPTATATNTNGQFFSGWYIESQEIQDSYIFSSDTTVTAVFTDEDLNSSSSSENSSSSSESETTLIKEPKQSAAVSLSIKNGILEIRSVGNNEQFWIFSASGRLAITGRLTKPSTQVRLQNFDGAYYIRFAKQNLNRSFFVSHDSHSF